MKDLFTPLNFGLDETLDMLREQVNNFACEAIAPLASQADQDNQFPNQLWTLMGEMGLLGVTVSEEYGGATWDIWLMLLPWKKLVGHRLLSV